MKKLITPIILIVLYFGIPVLATEFSFTLDTDTPAGSDAPSVIDDRIREVKDAFIERLNVDHFFIEDTSDGQVQASDTGGHRQLTMGTLTATPTITDAQGKYAVIWVTNDTRRDLFFTNASHTVRLTASGTTYTDTDGTTIEFTADVGVSIVASSVTAAHLATSSVSDVAIATRTIRGYNIFSIFGVRNDRDQDGSADTVSVATEYAAVTDGIVTIVGHGGTSEGGELAIKTSASGASPTTELGLHNYVGGVSGAQATLNAPITRGSHWTTVGPTGSGATSTVFWQPIGE